MMPIWDENRDPRTGQKKGWGYSGSYAPRITKAGIGGKAGKAFTADEIAKGAGRVRLPAPKGSKTQTKPKAKEKPKKKDKAKPTPASKPPVKMSHAMLRAQMLGKKFL